MDGPVISLERGFLGFTDKDNGKYYFKNDFVRKFNEIINKMKNTGELQIIIDDFVNR